MKKIVILSIGAVFGLSSQMVLADYVKGFPAGWACKGSCNAVASNCDITSPPNSPGKYGHTNRQNSVTRNSPLSLGAGREGGKLVSTAFTVAAGDKVEFYFNYVSSDSAGFPVNGWSRLLNASYNRMAGLLLTARSRSSGNNIPRQNKGTAEAAIPNAPIIIGTGADGAPMWSSLDADSGTCYSVGCGYTDWVLSSYTISTEESYQLELAASEFDDGYPNSGLALDRVSEGGRMIDRPSSVPAPAAFWLFGSAIAWLGSLARRRQITQV